MAKHMMAAKEAGIYIGGPDTPVSYYTMLQWAKRGKIPHCKIGSRVLFSQEAIDTWIEQQEAASVKSLDESQGYGKLRKIYG